MKSHETHIKDKKPEVSTDNLAEHELREAISKALGAKIHDRSVSVKGGLATLHGEVDDSAQIAAITAIAERVKGIKNTENKIALASRSKEPGAKMMPTGATEKTKPAFHETKSGGPGCG
jgi:osmotically-inducible protein OsmY